MSPLFVIQAWPEVRLLPANANVVEDVDPSVADEGFDFLLWFQEAVGVCRLCGIEDKCRRGGTEISLRVVQNWNHMLCR